jgi:hypothetical protein
MGKFETVLLIDEFLGFCDVWRIDAQKQSNNISDDF